MHRPASNTEMNGNGMDGELSATKIAALLKDPNSWVYKLYITLQLQRVMVAEAVYIQYLLTVIELKQEMSVEQDNAELDKQLYSKEAQQRQQLLAENVLTSGALLPEQIAAANGDNNSLLAVLNDALAVLLLQNQDDMNQTQLHAQHQAIMNNVNQQVLIGVAQQLSSNPQLASLSQLPIPTTPRPVPSLTQVLERTGLGETLKGDEKMQEGFATFHAKAETGPLGVFGAVQHIINNLGEEVEDAFDKLSIADKKKLYKAIDAEYKNVAKEFKGLTDVLVSNCQKVVAGFFGEQPKPVPRL